MLAFRLLLIFLTLASAVVPSLAMKSLPAQDVFAELPLVNTNVIHGGRWAYPDEDGADIIRTRVKISDLALLPPPLLIEEGFEISRVGNDIKLPQPSDFQTSSPGVPWGEQPRPLKWFADQFSWRIDPIPVKSRPMRVDKEHNLITLSCSGELLRGATSEGGAKTGNARWPPTFNVHVDQDLSGSPLTTYSSLLPVLFQNTPLTLYNIWIAINDEQVRPLALRDRRYVKDGDLAAWQEDTFDIPSDRFVATNSSLGGWYYNSEMKRGDAFVFLTGETPNTSFGRPEAGDGIRYSVELRCVGFLFPKGNYVAAFLTAVWVMTSCTYILFFKKRNYIFT